VVHGLGFWVLRGKNNNNNKFWWREFCLEERHTYIYLPWDGWKEGKGNKINPKAF
jgi:hypothetical protein